MARKLLFITVAKESNMKKEKIGESKKNKGPNVRFEPLRVKLFDMITNEDGQGLTEYALILGVISLVCIATLSALGGNVYDAFFSKIQTWLTSVTK